jgi:hypothetical protein
MATHSLPKPVARVIAHAPGLRRLPVLRLLAVAEIAMLTRDHVQRLTPAERHRAVELIRRGRGRPRNLGPTEREELTTLVAKMDARGLAGEAADAISPVGLPDRIKYGPRRRGGNAA